MREELRLGVVEVDGLLTGQVANVDAIAGSVRNQKVAENMGAENPLAVEWKTDQRPESGES